MSDSSLDELIGTDENQVSNDDISTLVPLLDQLALNKSKIDGGVLNQIEEEIDVDYVYIGHTDSDAEEFTRIVDEQGNNRDYDKSQFPGTIPVEVNSRGICKDRNQIYLGAGYHNNILPKRTSGPKALHMSIKQCATVFPKEEIKKAINAELQQMFTKEVWIALSREAVKSGYKTGAIKNIITSSLFLKDKRDASNHFLKLKARLVAHGNRQLIDEIFGSKSVESPTASLASIMILLHLAASNGWKTVVGVGGAYLNAKLETAEFMRLSKELVDMLNNTELAFPETHIQEDGTVVVQLKKALYGLKQAGRAWYDLLSSELESQGYTRSDIDRCLFSKVVDGSVTHIAVYVDDLLIVSNDPGECQNLQENLRKAYSVTTVQDESDISFVGLEIKTDNDKCVKVRQLGYIKDILNHFKVGETEFEDYPCRENIMHPSKENDLRVDQSIYISGIMKLMYLSTRSRPDIAFAVSALASRSSDPRESDSYAMRRIVKYINKTKEEYLIFKFGGEITLSAYVDASFMCHRDMRSHTGYAIFADKIGSAGVVYRSIKQKTVANSSTEAEIISLHDLVQHLIWVQGIYDSLNVKYDKPTVIHDDNEATIRLNSVPVVNFSGRSKYIARKYFSVYEHVENGSVILRWTGTDDMIADVLTKSIIGNKYKKFKIHLMGHTSVEKISVYHNELPEVS